VREPEGYPVLSFCTSCGRDFSGDRMFDHHRTGVHEYTFREGLDLDPPREDGRRCLDEDEMRVRGWRPYSEEELRSSPRNRHRAGFGVQLWFDPAEQERARVSVARSREQRG